MADIQFEHIDPYVEGQGGDTGLTSRQKLRRNFEKIKSWMDSVATLLSGRYLSKVDDDEAEGVITFKAGALFGPVADLWGWVKEKVEGRAGTGWAWFKHLLADALEALTALIKGDLRVLGGDLRVEADEDGNGGSASISGNLRVGGVATLVRAIIRQLETRTLSVSETATIANLVVTGAAHFFKVVIDEIKAAGGSWVITPADPFTVDMVEDIEIDGIAGKRLLWRATDGERKRANKWQAGDQALCKTDNLAEGTGYDVRNKVYWSLVAAVSARPVQRTFNGVATDCHYIDIYCGSGEAKAAIPTDGAGVPLWDWNGDARRAAAGDSVAMLGHRGDDVPRQSAIYIAAYASIDTGLTAPLFASYEGIKSFELEKYRKTYKDARGAAFYGEFFSTATDSDGVNIEDLLTGSEIHLIYGEGSPLVTRPEQHWQESDYATRVEKWFYFDTSLEPASDGGRFWKWVLVAATETAAAHYGWQHVTDGDTTAALEKIADVASDGKLSGGGEKARVYLEWTDARKTFESLRAQALEHNDGNIWRDNTKTGTAYEYRAGKTYNDAFNDLVTAFYAVSTYLNDKTDYNSGVPAWINPENTTMGLKVTTPLPTWPENEAYASLKTGAEVYRALWAAFYDGVVEMTRALNAWQYKTIDAMGDDGLIDAAEKAALRQIFFDEVRNYVSQKAESAGIRRKINGTSEATAMKDAEENYRDALNRLGTYLDGATVTSEDGKYWVNYKESKDDLSWWLTGSAIVHMMAGDGRQELSWSDFVSGSTVPENIYPVWLNKEHDTEEQVVEKVQWDAFWKEVSDARQALLDAIAAGRQVQIENVADLQPEVFIQTDAPTDFKAGDHWYKPVSLRDPVTGKLVTSDKDGNPIYDHYIGAKNDDGELYWKLLSAATTSVFSQIASQIYAAVFDSKNSSSLVMRANSIESTVTGMDANMKELSTKVTQTKEKIEACVQVDGVKRSAVTLTEDEFRIDASMTTIEGDLNVKGLIMNSAQEITFNDTYVAAHVEYPDGADAVTVPASGFVHEQIIYSDFDVDNQMIVPVDLDTVKSIVIKGISHDGLPKGNASLPNAVSTRPLVVLPGYSSLLLDGFSEKLPAVHESGVQLMITNSYQMQYHDWWKGTTDSPSDSSLSSAHFWPGAVIIAACPTAVNWSSNAIFGTLVNQSSSLMNAFMANGVLARLLVLMPGQTVRLVSNVHHFGGTSSNIGTNVLTWIVENASDFAPITGLVKTTKNGGGSWTENKFNANDPYGQLSLLAHPAMSRASGDDFCFALVAESGKFPSVLFTNIS